MRAVIVLAAFGLAAAMPTDPLAAIKDKNPQAYMIIKALMANSPMGDVMKQLHGGKVVDHQIAKLPRKSFLELQSVMDNSAVGDILQDDGLEALKKKNPAAYAVVKALLAKQRMGLPVLPNGAKSFMETENKPAKAKASTKASDSEMAELGELAKTNPMAYSIVSALLMKQKMGVPLASHAKVALLQDDHDPLLSIKAKNPAIYNLVKALLAHKVKKGDKVWLDALKVADPHAGHKAERIMQPHEYTPAIKKAYAESRLKHQPLRPVGAQAVPKFQLKAEAVAKVEKKVEAKKVEAKKVEAKKVEAKKVEAKKVEQKVEAKVVKVEKVVTKVEKVAKPDNGAVKINVAKGQAEALKPGYLDGDLQKDTNPKKDFGKHNQKEAFKKGFYKKDYVHDNAAIVSLIGVLVAIAL